jgi:hypothetical protein
MNETELPQGGGWVPEVTDDAAEIRQVGHQRHCVIDVGKLDVRHEK